MHISHHLKQSVVFIDTTGGLSASRLLQMLRSETISAEEQVSGRHERRLKQTLLSNIKSADGKKSCFPDGSASENSRLPFV